MSRTPSLALPIPSGANTTTTSLRSPRNDAMASPSSLGNFLMLAQRSGDSAPYRQSKEPFEQVKLPNVLELVPSPSLENNFQRMTISRDSWAVSTETSLVCLQILEAMSLRDKYLFVPNNPYKSFCLKRQELDEAPPGKGGYSYKQHNDGVYRVYKNEQDMLEEKPLSKVYPAVEFWQDFLRFLTIVTHGPIKTMCYHRLKLLEAKFNIHVQLNEEKEIATQKAVPHRDFYNIHKVDGHIHLSSSMNQKHFLKFIKKKLRDHPDEVVINRDGKDLTLKQVFESLNLTPYDLSVDTLDVHADKKMFHRFDRFNLKYNPCGQSRLREIFLKTDNFIKGKYFAELTQEIFNDLEASKYINAEYRVSIYGRNRNEWSKLAAWVVDNNLFSDNVRWLIQIPRLYHIYKESKDPNCVNFKEYLDNVFGPLFDITEDPNKDPKLHKFLKRVVGIDSVDDESKLDEKDHETPPNKWDSEKNPGYCYYTYYFYANIHSLNKFREDRNLPTFSFRPHAGEVGDVDHLACSYLLASGINHGINLKKAPSIQYFYFLSQIGLAMSPLSNNALFLEYNKNPFPNFFARGLNVTVSTDDPLQFHYSREPLIEEYSVAKAVWNLSPCDLSEIARNSVIQSGFEHDLKCQWLGEGYWKGGPESNHITKTNIPNIRAVFRHECLQSELTFIKESADALKDI
eukprot:TRINITY_DN1346_c0_g1_i1.p1 TRINITY_DN1346_c0_g1~~TRINITY_DN1346_c0_g1_i1.p1  ORF type:complete len:706 (-),score=238.52 TRINITY_DN1346_c0_g1_i1:36-2087(-)